MAEITDNLHGVLQNIVNNRGMVDKNLKTVQQAVSQLDAESLASINQLLKKFEHPQSVAQFVQAVAQKTGLDKALAEMDTAIAVLQTAADDEAFQLQAHAQLVANQTATAAPAPLPAAGSGSEPAPANTAVAAGEGQQTST